MVVVAMVACSDDSSTEGGGSNGGNNGGGQTTQASLTVSPTNVDFSTDGGTGKVTITSTAEWTAEFVNDRADDWCSIDATSGSAGSSTLTITTTANDTPDDRTASVVVKSGSLSKTINVSQKQQDALTVTSSKFEVDAEGGEIVVEVKANVDFEYVIDESAKEWISYEGTRAIQTSTLVFKVDENDDTEKREGKITIESGEFSEEVMVYQAGTGPSIVISQNEYTVSSAGETIAVEVKSNVDVAVEIPDNVDWIKESTTRATSTNTYYFDILLNEEYEQRSAEIMFINKENNLAESVKVTQTQKDTIVMAKSEYEVGVEGGTLDFEIATNVDVSVTISDNAKDWIQQVETRAVEAMTLYFNVSAYSGNGGREGTITISGGNTVQSITVRQGVFSSQILYTTTDNNIISEIGGFYDYNKTKLNIISNVYEDGQGVMTFDGKLTYINYNSFVGRSTLKSIIIPEGVVEIGYYDWTNNSMVPGVGVFGAFRKCTNLESVTLPNSLSVLGIRTFLECSSLKDINIPNGLTTIEGSTFAHCVSLTSLTIPNNITTIGEGAFTDCNSLTSLTIPSNVTTIGDGAFSGCDNLTSINIPNGITAIEDSTFEGCKKLSSIYIPNSVSKIGQRAFYGCESLTSISIPHGVTSIEYRTFDDCYNLISVDLPDGIVTIGEYAFCNCKKLKSIIIPNSVTTIGNFAFHDTAVITITIPSGVTSIGKEAFNMCESLASVYCKPKSVPQLGARGFVRGKYSTSPTIYVPMESVDEYKIANEWKEYADYIVGYDF